MNTELSTKLNLNYNFDEYETFDELLKVQDEVAKFNKAIKKYTSGFVQSFLYDFTEVEKTMNEHSLSIYNKYLNFDNTKMEDVISALSISMESNVNYCYGVSENRKYANPYKINEWFLKVEKYLIEMGDDDRGKFLSELEDNVGYFVADDVLFEPYTYTYDDYSNYDTFSTEDDINMYIKIEDSFCVVPPLKSPKFYKSCADGEFEFDDRDTDYNRMFAIQHDRTLGFNKVGLKYFALELTTQHGDY